MDLRRPSMERGMPIGIFNIARILFMSNNGALVGVFGVCGDCVEQFDWFGENPDDEFGEYPTDVVGKPPSDFERWMHRFDGRTKANESNTRLRFITTWQDFAYR